MPASSLVAFGLLVEFEQDVEVLLLPIVEPLVGRAPGPRRCATITRWLAQRLLAGR